jgi:hypothetical protein
VIPIMILYSRVSLNDGICHVFVPSPRLPSRLDRDTIIDFTLATVDGAVIVGKNR